MASVSLTDAGAGLPRRRESPRFRSPWRSGREEGKGAGASSPPSSPAARAALTPSPSPALRARGGHGLGIVDRRRRRIATATRTSPLPLPVAERKGTRGKVLGHHPPFLSCSAGDQRGIVIDVGESGHHPPFLSRSAGEEGGWGEGEGHQARCTPIPARRGAAYSTRHRSSDHDSDVPSVRSPFIARHPRRHHTRSATIRDSALHGWRHTYWCPRLVTDRTLSSTV